MNSVEWNPKHNLLAYAGDDKNKYQADEGNPFLSYPSFTIFGEQAILRLCVSSLSCVFYPCILFFTSFLPLDLISSRNRHN